MRLKQYIQETEFIDDLQLDEGGGFDYSSGKDQDTHRTIKGLMKNNGIFKSMKQRWFLLEKSWKHEKVGSAGGIYKSPSDVKKLRNIKGVEMGEYVVDVSAFMKFGKRGAGQGTRRVEWGYVIDDVGIREEYKYGFEYKDGGNWSGLDHSKIKKLWTRKEDDKVKEFRAQVAQEDMDRDKQEAESAGKLKASEWIGDVGERIKGHYIEVLRKHYFDTQYGESSITVMKDQEGNMLQHFGRNQLKKGDSKTVDFTVKGHEVAEINKWNKVAYKYTAVNRVK